MSAQSLEATKLHAVPVSPEIVFEVEAGWPLIPDAIYVAVCTGCQVRPSYGILKTYFHFRIIEGEHQEKVLFAAYNVKGRIVPGKGPGTGPRPRLARGLDLFKMLCRVLNLPRNTKAHRVSSRELIGKLYRVQTRTVTKDYAQKDLPVVARYSVVDDILSIEAG